MPGIQKSLRLPAETLREIERMAQESGKDFSGIAKDLLEEAIKMRRCPGIVFVEGTSGRRARLAGTGIEAWEIIATFQSLKKDAGRLKKSYHWLSPEQLEYPKSPLTPLFKRGDGGDLMPGEKFPSYQHVGVSLALGS